MRRRCGPAALAALLAIAAVVPSTVTADGLALDDSYTTPEDSSLFVAPGEGVLANDIGGPAVLCVVGYDTSTLTGTLESPGADGSFTYAPPADFNGSTTFAYTVATMAAGVCPTLGEGSATVTITVTPVNDAPTAGNDSFSGLSGRTLNIGAPGVLGNDADIDGDSLTAVLETGPTHGTLSLAANGGFSYTPRSGYTGSDVFAYHASDGSASSQSRAVSLTITALPATHAPPPASSSAPTTAAPASPSSSPGASPSESPLPSDSGLPSPSPSDSGLFPSPSASPSPVGPIGGFPEPAGIPILAIAALGVIIGLLTVAAVFFVQSQRGGAGSADVDPVLRPLEPDDLDDDEL